jgi:hypothetical protein
MVRRSASQQKMSNGMLAKMLQQANHVSRCPLGPPTIKTAKSVIKNAPDIIMPEMAHTVISPDTGKPLKHQELITLLRYNIRWMRTTFNESGIPLPNEWEQTNWTEMHHKIYPRIVGAYGSHMDVSQQQIS